VEKILLFFVLVFGTFTFLHKSKTGKTKKKIRKKSSSRDIVARQQPLEEMSNQFSAFPRLFFHGKPFLGATFRIWHCLTHGSSYPRENMRSKKRGHLGIAGRQAASQPVSLLVRLMYRCLVWPSRNPQMHSGSRQGR
jgi:hypothetical protein